MKWYSTRNSSLSHSLRDAAIMGLAPDGGLFMPERIPQADMDVVRELGKTSFAEMSAYLARLFFDEFSAEDLSEITTSAFPFGIPMKEVGKGLMTLELFHGPTFAFKDVGAGFMGRMLGRLAENGKTVNVIVATSGDTGSAVANGFHNVNGVNVTILYPKGKISPFQESQMTTLGGNIHPVAVEGCFDDCQAMVKRLLSDREFHDEYRLTSANSINILRWVPQCFYYFWGWCRWEERSGNSRPVIVVPSGNLGNLAAGILAKRMGLPVAAFVAANNSNDTFSRYLLSGEYLPEKTVATVANAMDVSAPSNFERILSLYGQNWKGIASEISGRAYDDGQILKAMKELSDLYGYFSCPHSATAYLALKDTASEGFWLSTAHYAKFNTVLSEALGRTVAEIEPFKSISALKGKHIEMPVDTNLLKDYIKSL